MDKRSLKKLVTVMLAFFCLAVLCPVAHGESEQHGKTKITKETSEGELAPVKENICKNPKLCDSIEIDILSNLQTSKVPPFLPKPQATGSTQEYQIALNLGIVVTDALSAIIGKDKAAFLQYAGMIKDYGKKLEVSDAVLGKYDQLVVEANKGEWVKLETMTYEFKDAITGELNTKKKAGAATLSMVAGGLEGLYIEAKSLEKNFSKTSADYLHNPGLFEYLTRYMRSLDEALKAKGEVKAIAAALPPIGKILNQPKTYEYTKKDVEELVKILEPVRQAALGGDKKS
jgi:hypothetical protein